MSKPTQDKSDTPPPPVEAKPTPAVAVEAPAPAVAAEEEPPKKRRRLTKRNRDIIDLHDIKASTQKVRENVVRSFLRACCGVDERREGLKDTPKRVVEAWKFFTSGYKKDPDDILKVFEDGAERYDEVVLVSRIPVFSVCEHHLLPFFGHAHVAYLPAKRIVGLSKLARVVDIYARRLQVQERLTQQVANAIHSNLNPRGVGVMIECRHLCMEMRGVQSHEAVTVSSCLLGAFKSNPALRAEFMSLRGNLK